MPKKFWIQPQNQKKFFHWLMEQLGYKCMDDWYKVTVEDIHKNGGSGPLDHYNNSRSKALMNIYPEHNWELNKFKNKASGRIIGL